MNLPQFLQAVAKDFAEKAKSGAADVGYEVTMEAMISSYRKICQLIAKRYLNHAGTDPEILRVFRDKFISMLRLTTITLDEVDSYLTAKYVDRRGRVMELYVTAAGIKREVKKSIKKKDSNHG